MTSLRAAALALLPLLAAPALAVERSAPAISAGGVAGPAMGAAPVPDLNAGRLDPTAPRLSGTAAFVPELSANSTAKADAGALPPSLPQSAITGQTLGPAHELAIVPSPRFGAPREASAPKSLDVSAIAALSEGRLFFDGQARHDGDAVAPFQDPAGSWSPRRHRLARATPRSTVGWLPRGLGLDAAVTAVSERASALGRNVGTPPVALTLMLVGGGLSLFMLGSETARAQDLLAAGAAGRAHGITRVSLATSRANQSQTGEATQRTTLTLEAAQESAAAAFVESFRKRNATLHVALQRQSAAHTDDSIFHSRPTDRQRAAEAFWREHFHVEIAHGRVTVSADQDLGRQALNELLAAVTALHASRAA